MPSRRLLVLHLPGLALEHFRHPQRMPNLTRLLGEGELHRMQPVFPAVTLPVQASLTTGAWPEAHGVVANGFYFAERHAVSFWEQAAPLVAGERIWSRLHRQQPQLKTAVLFLQSTLFADCEIVLTPKPLHEEEGLIPWCYAKPPGLYEELCTRLGHFPLHHYWGPLAGIESSRWIAAAALQVLERHRPDLTFVYLPHLDYAGQKHPPGHPAILEELSLLDTEIGTLLQGIEALGLAAGISLVVLGEYAFQAVRAAIPLNLLLRRAGLLQTRTIAGRDYLDIELSPAFAMVDHQIAHLYIRPGWQERVRQTLEQVDGIAHLLGPAEQRRHRCAHPRGGDLVAVSARDCWFSYPWWEEAERAPGFASRVDIHRKPGYDPLELFFEPGSRKIATDPSLIRGSHGYLPQGPEDEVPLLVSRTDRPPAIPSPFPMPGVAPLLAELLSA